MRVGSAGRIKQILSIMNIRAVHLVSELTILEGLAELDDLLLCESQGLVLLVSAARLVNTHCFLTFIYRLFVGCSRRVRHLLGTDGGGWAGEGSAFYLLLDDGLLHHSVLDQEDLALELSFLLIAHYLRSGCGNMTSSTCCRSNPFRLRPLLLLGRCRGRCRSLR